MGQDRWDILPETAAAKGDYARGDAKLFLGDSIEIMGGMVDNSVDVVVTSPPYNTRANGP